MQISPVSTRAYNGSINSNSYNSVNSSNPNFGLKITKDRDFRKLYNFLLKYNTKEKVDEAIKTIEAIKPQNGNVDDYLITFYPIKMTTRFEWEQAKRFSDDEVKKYYYSPASFYSFSKYEPPKRIDYMLSFTTENVQCSENPFIPLHKLVRKIKSNFESYLHRNNNNNNN